MITHDMNSRTSNGESADLSIEYSLLGFLSERPMHGYELSRELDAATGLGLIWKVKMSNLYGLLDRLKKRGLVTAERQEQAVRPARKVFRLTARGRSALEEWTRSPVPHGRSIRLEFMAKLYLAWRVDGDTAAELIEAQEAACKTLLDAIEEREENAASATFDRLVHAYRASQLRATLDWLASCRDFIRDNDRRATT